MREYVFGTGKLLGMIMVKKRKSSKRSPWRIHYHTNSRLLLNCKKIYGVPLLSRRFNVRMAI